jgi:dUTP pyrophosphatase
MTLRVTRLVPGAVLPKRGSDGAVGYDLVATHGCVILPGQRGLVPTGLSLELPSGTYGRVAPRSGLAVKNGLDVGAGVIDPDYRGEIKVVLFNFDTEPFLVKPGYRVAQLVIEKCETPEVVEVDKLDETERGEGGFGSTGISSN